MNEFLTERNRDKKTVDFLSEQWTINPKSPDSDDSEENQESMNLNQSVIAPKGRARGRKDYGVWPERLTRTRLRKIGP